MASSESTVCSFAKSEYALNSGTTHKTLYTRWKLATKYQMKTEPNYLESAKGHFYID